MFVDGVTSVPLLSAAPGPQSPGWQHLCALAAAAAIVVVEEMPVPPEREWVNSLKQHLTGTGTGLLAVDTSCCMPMRVVRDRYEKYGDCFVCRLVSDCLWER